MKKFLFAMLAASVCFFTACNNSEKTASSTTSSATQKNLDASHIVNKAFETGDASMIDSAVASNFVDHTDRGDMGRDSLKAMVASMHKDFPDMKMDIIKELADDEYVFTLMRFTGTSNGTMGMPKGPYDMQGLEVVKYKDGKAVEHWEYMQPSEVMKMMNQMQHPAEKTDTQPAPKKYK